MERKHSPSGSIINKLTGKRPEVSRRDALFGLGLLTGAVALAACGGNSGETTTPSPTSKTEIGNNTPTPAESVTPTPKEYGPEDYRPYSELDLDKQYTDVPIWKVHRYSNGPVNFERSGCSSEGMTTPFRCDNNEVEYFQAFTLKEMAADCKKPEADENRVFDRANLRHFLLETVLAEKYPNDPAFRGLGRYGNPDYDNMFSIEKALPKDAKQRADNVWPVLGKEGRLAQGVAIDIRNGKIDKEQGDQLLWMLCTAMTGDDNTANDLRDFVTERAGSIKSPEEAEQCMNWWASTKPMPADSSIGDYQNSDLKFRAVQLRVPNEGSSTGFISSTYDGIIFEGVDKTGVDSID